MKTLLPLLLLGVGTVLGAGAARADAPVPVSPGAPDRFAGVGSPCPTFSWSAVERAKGYEVVVYRASLPEEAFPGAADPVLRARIPAGAVTWTPPAEECLELAGSYAWLVRATGPGEARWSSSRLFRVDVDAVLAEMVPVLKRALERELRRPDDRAEWPGAAARGVSGGGSVSVQPSSASSSPEPSGVFTDDVELWLEETGSGESDKVQLVFATPEFDGSPSDAWTIVVEAEDSSTAGADAGKLFFNTPGFFDALQLFTDGSAIVGEQREMKLRRLDGPPIGCTSFLQEGMLYWDLTINALCACDGSSWAPVDADETGSCV